MDITHLYTGCARPIRGVRNGLMPQNASLPILVVDDNRTMVRITTELLRQVGYVNVDGAADGSQALAMAAKKTYDLVISDWNMAEVKGLDLLRALKPTAG